MAKSNYFDSLERLGVLCHRAVFISCSSQSTRASNELLSIREISDKIVCTLEKKLFSDFMPPLERATIAACAHSVLRVMDKCSEITSAKVGKNFYIDKKSKEAELCIRLCELIEENIFRLKKIKKPEEFPDFSGFRKLISEARCAHIILQRRLNSGVYPRSAQHTLTLLGQLRTELSHCFDDIIEIMLQNI